MKNNFEEKNKNGKEAVNFIYDLDEAASNTDMKYIFRSVVFDINNRANNNFIFRKDTRFKTGKTRILYIKDGVRTRFTDNDVLEMILNIEEKHIVQKILEIFKKIYLGEYETLLMRMGDQNYVIPALPIIEYDKELDNRKDISIRFDDLYVLINLIIAKDVASTDVIKKMDYLKRTLTKYILVIGYYYFKGEKEKECLQLLGIDVTEEFYTDFETGEKASEYKDKIIKGEKLDLFSII